MARGDRVEVVIAAVNKVAEPIRRINRQIETMLAPVRKVQRAFRNLAKEAHLEKVGKAFRWVGRQVARLAIGGTAALGVLGVAIERLSTRGDAVAKLTRQLKFNSDAFQELEFAADREGISSGEFRSSIVGLTKRMGQLKAGTGSLAGLLKEVDPQFGALLARTSGTEEAFDLLIKKIASYKDPAKQAALATAAFGRSGAVMIRLAKIGADEIDALRKRARELGLVMSKETLAASEQLNDDLTDLKAVAFGLWQQIGGKLMPIVSAITERITAWAVENQKLITDKAIEYVTQLADAGKKVYAWLVDAIPKVVEFVDKIGGLKTVAIATGVVLTASLLAPIVALVGAIGLVPAALLAIGAGVVAFWEDIKLAIQPALDQIEKLWTMFGPTDFGTGLDTSNYALAAGPAQGMDSDTYKAWQADFNQRKADLQGEVRVVVDDRRTKVMARSETPGVKMEVDRGSLLP